MDWVAKGYFQWDWENLALFSGKDCEISKAVEESHWRIDGGMDIGNGSLYSSGGACSRSDLGNVSSKSSLSASIDSSKKIGGRMSELNFDSVGRNPANLNKNRELPKVEDSGTSPVVIAADGLCEPVIGLKLGKRTYFEDTSAGNSTKNPVSTSVPTDTVLVKKPRISHQTSQSIYCQVEGCRKDLTAAKEYHRKHRVCEIHSKSSKVVVAGLERRFCQQCSRFHGLSEFDQKKRSCRRRLSDHNARRRKPQPETISFSSPVSSQYYSGDKQQVNLVFGRAPFSHLTTSTSTAWDFSAGFKESKLSGNAQNQTFPNTDLSNNFSTINHDLDRLFPFKGTTANYHYQGPETSNVTLNMNGAPDLRRAFSLLSTDSFCTANLGLGSNFQIANTINVTTAHPNFHLTGATPSFCQEQPPEKLPSFHAQNSNLQYQEFQLHKSQYDTSLFGANELQ